MKIRNKLNRPFIIVIPLLVFMGMVNSAHPAPTNGDPALSVDTQQLQNAISQEVTAQIQQAIDSNVQKLQDAAMDRIYQQVRKAIQDNVDTELVQKRFDEFLNQNPTVNMLFEDYTQQKSQTVITDLQGLYGEANTQLQQILNSLKAYQEEEIPPAEFKQMLEQYGFKGRWIDKMGEWEQFYQKYGASYVEDMKTLYSGFHGGEPGGQLLSLFSLMEKYSSKVPGLGQFIKLYAQVGKEMLAAAIRTGELIRRRDQGCLGDGSHGGIKNWYNLGDPVNIAFSEVYEGRAACPTIYKNIFRDEDDSQILYFWTGKGFLYGHSGNGGTMAIAQIIAFLREAGMAGKADDMATLQRFYNSSFPTLKELCETILNRITDHIARLDNVRIVCGEQAFLQLLRDYGKFDISPAEFEDRKPKIFQRMIISEVLEDGTALETYTKAESGLDQLSAVVLRGKIFIDRDGNIELVPDAKVRVTGTGGSIFSGCQQLTSDDEGKYRFVYLLSESQAQLQLKAKKNDLESDLEDVFLQKSDFYRDYVNLELKQESDSTLVIKDLYLSPASATILVGESGSFVARAEYTDGSTKDVTSQASWTGGDDNTVTGKMPDEITLTASYSGRSGSATVTIKCPEDRPEWNSELGECTSIESAIDSLTEEEETDEYCDEQNMNGEWIQTKQWISKVGMIESGFQIKYNKFMKEINDQNSNVCKNDILAIALAGAKEDMSRFEIILEQIKSSSTSLILQLGICPDLEVDFGVKDIVQALAQVRPIRSRIIDNMADMQILLADYGCDEQEITERGEEVADNTIDPNVIDDGGAGGEEICGDGKDNDGDGLIDEGCESTGNYNVAIYLYDSGSAKDDIFSLSVSGFGNQGTTPEGGARTYPLYLPPGTYTAIVTVVLAPDDAGTFTITVKQYDRVIAAQSGSPPQGTQISIGFTVEESDAVDADAVMFPASMDMGGEMEIMVFPNEESMGKKGQNGLIRAFPEE